MNDQIREIVNIHCEQIKSQVNTESIAKAIRSVDTMVQKMYAELYGLRDIRHPNHLPQETQPKKGHCC